MRRADGSFSRRFDPCFVLRLRRILLSSRHMRINKYISKSGFCSRRRAEEFVAKGLVVVDGIVVQDLGHDVPKTSKVTVDGRDVAPPSEYMYVILNKPVGYTCTKNDPHAEHTVYELLHQKFRHLDIVGRLDVDSTGLVLFSDDGDFVQRVTHPKYEVEKEYWLEVKGMLDEDILNKAKAGIQDEGEELRIDSYKIVHAGPVKSRALVVLHQGRKREIRRIFKVLERFVVKLKRVRIGNIELGEVEEGKTKELRDFDPVSFLKARKQSRRSDFVKERKKLRREKKTASQVTKAKQQIAAAKPRNKSASSKTGFYSKFVGK